MLFFILVINGLTPFMTQGISYDSTVRIYDSFAEIQQLYHKPLRFRQPDWDNIKHESIILQSTSEKNNIAMFFERRIVRINSNMTGLLIIIYYRRLSLFICFQVKQYSYVGMRNKNNGFLVN